MDSNLVTGDSWSSMYILDSDGDTVVTTNATILHGAVVSNPALTTAGYVTIRNGVAVGGDIVMYIYLCKDLAYFTPRVLLSDIRCPDGLFVDWDGTVDGVGITVLYA